jgi:hypothetical protein
MPGAKSTKFAGDVLDLLLNNIAIDGVADALIIGGNTFVALHEADPGADGAQTDYELNYQGYQRMAVARNNAAPHWAIVNGEAKNTQAILWPLCLGGTGVARWFSIGRDESGTGCIFYRAPITNPPDGLVINPGIAPEAKQGLMVLGES